MIGPGAKLVSANHPLDPRLRHEMELQPVRVKKNVWIGADAKILHNITVGENTVVSAGAVVTKGVPANTIVGGVPAKIIRKMKNNI